MAITSASTQADIVGQYLDNAGYDITESVASAKLFVEACRALLIMQPSDWQHGASKIGFDPAEWRREKLEAQTWIQANGTAGQGSVKHLSFGVNFR